jgi:hypothetical protein
MLPTSNQLHAKRNGRINPTLEKLSEYLATKEMLQKLQMQLLNKT